MKRPFSSFLLAVVLPCGAAMLLASSSARSAWDDLHRSSHAHVARMALASFEQDLGGRVTELAAQAPPYVGADPNIPAIRRAMEGDTVAGLTATENGAELAVMLGDATAPDTTQVPVRYIVAPMEPTAAAQVGRATGYEVSLYLNARLWGGTDPAPGPQRLDEGLLLELSRNAGGIRLPGSDAVLQAESPRPGAPPPLVTVASPGRVPAPAVELRIALVLGLLLLCSALTGWIQLGGRPGRDRSRSRPGVVLALALLPALTTALFLVHLSRTFEATAAEVTAANLTRGLAVAGAREIASSPEGVRLITGFQATLVGPGGTLESTFNADPHQIRDVPAPPSSFTTSGTVDTPEGPSLFVALRREGGSIMVATTPVPAARIAAFRGTCIGVGGALMAWLIVLGGFLLLRSRR